MTLETDEADSNDRQGGMPEAICDRLVAGARDGAVALTHHRKQTPATALCLVLDGLVAQGLRVGPQPSVLRRRARR